MMTTGKKTLDEIIHIRRDPMEMEHEVFLRISSFFAGTDQDKKYLKTIENQAKYHVKELFMEVATTELEKDATDIPSRWGPKSTLMGVPIKMYANPRMNKECIILACHPEVMVDLHRMVYGADIFSPSINDVLKIAGEASDLELMRKLSVVTEGRLKQLEEEERKRLEDEVRSNKK